MGTTYSKPRLDSTFEAFDRGPATDASPATVAQPVPGLPVVSLQMWRYRYAKRAVDLVLGSMMLAVSLVPGLLIGAVIWLTSKGPVFYREERMGRNGSKFRIWKFRTMRADAALASWALGCLESGAEIHWRMVKHVPDPRITPVGRVLRCWSLDELPQIFNVLLGEMSLVGPRPIVEAESGFYADSLPFYLAAVPGLSGLWQVSGRCCLDYNTRVAMDTKYVTQWSLRNDLLILLRTLPAVLGRQGAH